MIRYGPSLGLSGFRVASPPPVLDAAARDIWLDEFQASIVRATTSVRRGGEAFRRAVRSWASGLRSNRFEWSIKEALANNPGRFKTSVITDCQQIAIDEERRC